MIDERASSRGSDFLVPTVARSVSSLPFLFPSLLGLDQASRSTQFEASRSPFPKMDGPSGPVGVGRGVKAFLRNRSVFIHSCLFIHLFIRRCSAAFLRTSLPHHIPEFMANYPSVDGTKITTKSKFWCERRPPTIRSVRWGSTLSSSSSRSAESQSSCCCLLFFFYSVFVRKLCGSQAFMCCALVLIACFPRPELYTSMFQMIWRRIMDVKHHLHVVKVSPPNLHVLHL